MSGIRMVNIVDAMDFDVETSNALMNTGLFPFDRALRLARDVVDDAVDAAPHACQSTLSISVFEKSPPPCGNRHSCVFANS
ncbi:MAG TPA: hypothetical protein VEI03_14720 [Stellaceae bacterium]|nr:hypothetical protein [Stellaceae bacterium]